MYWSQNTRAAIRNGLSNCTRIWCVMLCDNTVQICTDIANLIWWKVNTKITTEYQWYVPQYIRFTNMILKN